MDLVKKAYADGVLDKKYHASIIRRLGFFSEQTRVPVKYICSSATDWLSPEEIQIIKTFRELQSEGKGGILFHGATAKRSMMSAFCAIGGWMIRNKIDARIYTAVEVANDLRLDGPGLPDCRVFLFPDFFITNRPLTDWQKASIQDVVYSRFASGLFTILYADDLSGLKGVYGKTLSHHIGKTYKGIKA